eukprot:CAMPEP_0178902998 /NCGR_PEP_ID=MMETSP0786-20121207/4916_1 /TAXON_ID=186022 /ORGANISM="Thalassionema frauenfeldii, Strain CCMP 1798" /LENGTH=297 /DNA_ID=CAMNT_0020574327 /DNA_START=105 /DNA_END=998 /DNA_ORIENTATION=+
MRQAERAGRIKAEVKLRSLSKKSASEGSMSLKRIGSIVSPYTKRMGTPRQGALVPASRAFVQLDIPMETLDGIENYSHAWIIFEFHANTDLSSSQKTKIRPPRAGGIKVGQLSTRSPHRPNALGLSLVVVERLDRSCKRFYISAIDLVNGTPVYDIKPYVPWDSPEEFDGVTLKVPTWVEQDDTLSEVIFTSRADADMRRLISQKKLAPLYTEKNGGYKSAIQTVKQVLSQDPRASHKRGTTMSKDALAYSMIFCQTKVDFIVVEKKVKVMQLNAVDLSRKDFVDGIPLLHTNETEE